MFEHFFIPGLTDNYWVLEGKKKHCKLFIGQMNPKYTKNSNNKSPNVATKSGQIISTAYEMPNLGSYQRHTVLNQNEWARHPSQDNCYCLKINISARWTSIYCRWGCKHIQPWDRTTHIPQKNLKNKSTILDLTILLLDVYPKEMRSGCQGKSCTSCVCSTLW